MTQLEDVPQTFAVDRANVEATYLGDGAYVAINRDGQMVLTTENGIDVSNRIVLEPEYFQMLEHFAAMVRRKEIGRWK